MIVVEGPDGSGKTTLIREIQTQFPVAIAPRVVSKDAKAMVDLVEWVEKNNQQLDQGIVYDRHRLISEPIYGSVLRRQAETGFDDIEWMTMQLRAFYMKRPVLIYCIPPKDRVFANHESLPKDTTQDQASRIYGLYVAKAAADSAMGRAYLYDFTKGSQETRRVIGIINREEMF